MDAYEGTPTGITRTILQDTLRLPNGDPAKIGQDNDRQRRPESDAEADRAGQRFLNGDPKGSDGASRGSGLRKLCGRQPLERGRNFQTLFYEICDRRGVNLPPLACKWPSVSI